jgi:hypothetical protein
LVSFLERLGLVGCDLVERRREGGRVEVTGGRRERCERVKEIRMKG